MPFARSQAGPRSDQTPAHVAIIMDGNGRWARGKGLERLSGHERGADMRRCIAGQAFGVGHAGGAQREDHADRTTETG